MPYDATLNTDFPVLTTDDEVSRLVEMYRQDNEARSGSSTPPTAALTPTPIADYSGADEIGPAASAPTPAPALGAGEDTAAPTPPPTPAAPAASETEDWRKAPPPSWGGRWAGPPITVVSAEEAKPEKAGWMDIIQRGALRLFEDTGQSTEAVRGKQPTKTTTPEAEYEKPIEWGDFTSPTKLAEKLVFSTVRSGAQIPAGIVGAAVGGAAGSVFSPVGTAIGGVAGSAGLMGLVAAAQELGPAYRAELDKTPKDPDGAFDRAVVAAGKSGLITTASMAVFTGATPFAQLVKGAFTRAAATRAAAEGGTAVEKAAAEAAARKIMGEAAPGIVQQTGIQTVAQPAVVAGGTAAGNIVEGKPVGEGVIESGPGALANVALGLATHGAGKLVPGRRRPAEERPPGERPSPGEEYGPPEPYGPPTPPPAEPPVPPPSPDLGPSVIQQRYGANPPAELPTATATGLSPIQQRYGVNPEPLAGPRGAVEQGPAVATEDPAIRAATDAAVNPPGAAAEPSAEPPARGPSRIQERYGNQPPEATPPLPVVEPGAARSRLQERVGTGRDTTAPPPEITPDIISRDNIVGVPEKPLTPSRDITTDITTEPDHLDPSRHVAKNPAGEVIGKGASPEEALADAQARGRAPYAEETTQPPRGRQQEIVNEPAVPTTEAAPVVPPIAGEPAAATKARATSKAKAKAAAAVPPISGEPAAATKAHTTSKARVTEKVAPEKSLTTEGGLVKAAKAAPVVVRPTPRREVAIGKRGEAAVSEEVTPPPPATVGEEMQQRRLAQKRGEEAPTGPPTVTRANQPKRVSLMAQEITRAGGRRPGATVFTSARAREPTRGTPVEAIAEGEGARVTPSEGGIAETRAATTTDTNLRYGDQLHDVLQGNKDIATAARDAGTKEPGTRGRPRKNAGMANYLDERIAKAEEYNKADQARMEEVRDTLNDKTLSQSDKDARLEELLATMPAQIRARGRGEYERERLEDLKKYRDELRGGFTEGVDKVIPRSPDSITRQGKKLYERLLDRSVNRKLLRRLTESDRGLGDHSIHDYLGDIANDPVTKLAAPHLATAAKRLMEILPREVRVASYDTIATITGAEEIRARHDKGALGTYFSGADTIGLNARAPHGLVETVVHEALHAATFKYLKHLDEKVARGEDLTAEETRHHAAMNAMKEELWSILEAQDEVPRSSLEHRELDYAVHANEPMGDIAMAGHEMLTQVLSNPSVQTLLARTPPTVEFKAEMKRLGYGEPATVWQAFKSFLKDILGFKKGSSVLDLVLDPLTDIVESGAQHRLTTGSGATLSLRGGAPARPRLSGPRRVPTDALPSDQARETMRPWGEAVTDRSMFSREGRAATTRDQVEGWKLGAATQAFRTMIAMPSHLIARYNRDVLPAGEKIVEAWGKTHRSAEDYFNKWGDKIQNWTRQLKYGPEVAKLMNDATLAEVYLTDQPGLFRERNQHLNADQMEVARGLQDRFNELTPEKQKLYSDVRDYYRNTHWEERKLEYEDIARRALPEASEAQIQALGEQLKTKAGIKEVIENPDSMSSLFAERWENSRATVREIANLQDMGFREGDYFQLRRYGEYVLRYGEAGTKYYGTEMFERSSEAYARRKQLLKELADDPDPAWRDVRVSDVLTKAAKPNPREFVPESVLSDVTRAMARSGASEAEMAQTKEAFAYAMLRRAVHSEGAMSRARRSGVRGASEDAGRTLWNHYMSTGTRQGHLIHGAAENEAFRQARQQVEALEAASGAPGTEAEIARSRAQLDALEARPGVSKADLEHVRQQHEWLEKPPTAIQVARARATMEEFQKRRLPDGDASSTFLGKSVGTFTKGSFIYHLVRPAHLALNVAESHANAQSWLGGEYGQGPAAVAIAKTMRDLAPTGLSKGFRNALNAVRGEMKHSDWQMSEVLLQKLIKLKPGDAAHEAEMRALIDAAHDYGMIDHTFAREVQQMAGFDGFDTKKPMPGWSNLPSNMMNLFTVGEHAVDATMRVTILKAAYDLAKRRNPNDAAQARREAIGFAGQAMPVYGGWNNPRIATPGKSPLGFLAPAMMQYKLYGMHMYTTMGSLVSEAVAHPEKRAEALKTMAGLIATHSLLAGVTANMFALPVVAALGAWDFFSGKEKPHNYETDMRQWITEIGGETAGTFASSGLIGLAGARQQRTVKLTNMVDVPEITSFDRAGLGRAILQGVTGASGQVAEQLFEAMHELTSGNLSRAAKLGLPRVFSDPYKAYELGQEGVVDRRGHTIAPPRSVSGLDMAGQALGFNPGGPALARERHAAGQEFTNEINYARAKAVDRYVVSGGRDMSGVRAYLADPVYRRDSPITISQLREALHKERQRAAHPELYGMSPSKRAARDVKAEMRFQ